MIYESKERAMAAAAEMNARSIGGAQVVAARTQHGWTVIQRSPYSQGGVIEYAA